MGVAGLWYGLAAAETPLLLVYLWVLYRADWPELALEASNRVGCHSDTDTDSEVGGSISDEMPAQDMDHAQAREYLCRQSSGEDELDQLDQLEGQALAKHYHAVCDGMPDASDAQQESSRGGGVRSSVSRQVYRSRRPRRARWKRGGLCPLGCGRNGIGRRTSGHGSCRHDVGSGKGSNRARRGRRGGVALLLPACSACGGQRTRSPLLLPLDSPGRWRHC